MAITLLVVAVPLVVAFEGGDAENSSSCVHEVVYEAFGGIILVSVTVAESPPLDFVLDSGATQSSLTDPFLAWSLGLEARDRGLARGVGSGATRIVVAEDVCIRMDGVEVLRAPLVIHDISTLLAEGAGREIHGFLGAELFARYVVEIDPAGRRVLLHDPETFEYRGRGYELPIEIVGGRSVVEGVAVIEEGGKEVPVRLMVDTGSSRFLTLVTKSRRRLKPPSEQRQGASIGVVGETSVTLASIHQLRLGPIVARELETAWLGGQDVPAVRNIENLNGILGNWYLSQFRTIFDYRGRKLILEPLPRTRN
jgi:hypothetical protein